jgi:hypothetical protein
MKEFSPFSSILHMGNNCSYLYFIFFLSVLLIEDTILLIDKTTASEAVLAIHTIVTVVEICNVIPAFNIK